MGNLAFARGGKIPSCRFRIGKMQSGRHESNRILPNPVLRD
jgi:hypothetical protein